MVRAKGRAAAGNCRNAAIRLAAGLGHGADGSLPCAPYGTMEGNLPSQTKHAMNPTVDSLEPSDAALVEQARNGSDEAFGKLFSRHYPKVYRYAVNMGASADDAEDIVQTAFIRTHKSLAKIRDGQALLSYLYQAAMNGLRDLRRRNSRRPWLSLASLLKNREGLAETETAVSPDETGAALSEALAAAIRALPEEFREVFVLHHLQELDLNQIAEIQRVPVGTVKSRLGRARERMRTAMRPWLDGDEAQ